jgi:hypothetical protein
VSKWEKVILTLTYHIPLLTVIQRLAPELLDSNENADSIADLFDPHFLQDFLVAFNEVIAIEIIR